MTKASTPHTITTVATLAPARPGTHAAAFFDLDKTIIATSSTTAFAKPFLSGGLITRGDVLRTAYAQFLYLVGVADEVQELGVRRAQHVAPGDQAAGQEGLGERRRRRRGDDRLVEVEEGCGVGTGPRGRKGGDGRDGVRCRCLRHRPS